LTDPPGGPAGGAPAGPAASKRLGPVRFRLDALALAALLAVAWTVVGFSLSTLHSLYPGTGVATAHPPERPAVGEVGECRRAGPVSVNGFGYWWECQVRIRAADGRQAQTVLRHSIVSPDDAGQPVELREACYGADNTDCRYGRPVSRGWGVAVKFLDLLTFALNAAFVFMIGVCLVAALIGPRRYDSLLAKFSRDDRRSR
jgi:Family of unknown function (DUF6346)